MLPIKPPLRALLLFVIASSTIFYLALYSTDLGSLVATTLPLSRLGADLNDKETFIQAVLDHEIDGPFDPIPIQQVCASKKWNDDLTFICGAPQGGIGNIRNVFLTCLRYAIEAGAAFVVPDIIARDTEDISVLTTNNTVPFDYFFDLPHFAASLRAACPQMILHTTPPVNLTLNPPVRLGPQSLLPEVFVGIVILHPEQWRPAFDTWLSTNSPTAPYIIELATPLLNYPVYSDPPAFGNSFGRLLRVRKPARRLAAAALHTMHTKYHVPFNPSGISPHAFFGAHLRAAADAAKAGWTSYETQAAFLLDFAQEEDLDTIYVTSESEPAVTFRADAKARGVVALAKEDLLDAEEVAALRAMTWDQQALVDFEVLLRATAFGGIDVSSFAWNVALRRHVLSDIGRGAWDNVTDEDGLNMKDEYSRLRGQKGTNQLFIEAMWP